MRPCLCFFRLGGSQSTELGHLAVDLSVDPNEQSLDNYRKMHADLVKQIKNSPPLYRSAMLAYINDSWMYQADVRTRNVNTAIMYHVVPKSEEAQEDYQYAHLKKVLLFCLSSNIVEKTGLTFKDFLTMDVATFDYVRKVYFEFKPAESGALDDALRSLDRETQAAKQREKKLK